MSKLSEVFKTKRKMVIPYVVAGFPDIETTEKTILALAEQGCQAIEIGIPFSDPVADGPAIQQASSIALSKGYKMADYLELIRRVRSQSAIALIAMTYFNPVQAYGVEKFDREFSRAGLDAILISDLVPEEYERLSHKFELDTIFLVAPTSTTERMGKICSVSRGFIYLVARTGITGEKTDFNSSVPSMVNNLRRMTKKPIAVGFGISNAGDVSNVCKHADAAIVGSAIVKTMLANQDNPQLIPALIGDQYNRLSDLT
jgi:tryptophan synthase alpha chain